MEEKTFEKEIAGRKMIINIGKLANQANGSAVIQYGDTVVLATATMSEKQREGVNFFPLMVDYEERLYAAGKIKGSRFIKREGRPTDEAILTSRMIDRSIRPFFNKRMRNDVQVILTILSIDQENDPDICSIIGASIALSISDIPWKGPIGVVRMSQIGDEVIANPVYDQREKSLYEIVFAGKNEKISMIEAAAKEAPEDKIIKAAKFSVKHIKDVIDFQNEIIQQVGKKKKEVKLVEVGEDVEKKIRDFLSDKVYDLLFKTEKKDRLEKNNKFYKDLEEFVADNFKEELKEAAVIIADEKIKSVLKENILKYGKRSDGRNLDEIRKINSQVGILPRTHGSGLFSRGDTQALTVATLGAPGDEQTLDGMEEVGTKRFMHHYDFPPFSVGEVAPIRGPGRREIGHGALAEKAVECLIPDKESFPYTIRLMSEIISSNGSSSMASVCGSSLALMDAGVPISRHIAGIAMGLISDKNMNYKILTDIQGPEDHYGDMDFKIAGTEIGITAMQMDVKIEGITIEMMEKAIIEAKKARMEIIKAMSETISKTRENLSPNAPRITTMKINPERIRDVIGPAGKTINEIIADTGVAIDIEDDGLIMITSKNSEAAEKAVKWIKDITREVVVGEVFKGRVKRITNFGVFVEILPNQEGMIRISDISTNRFDRIEDIVKVGDIIAVKVKEIDFQGRINLTCKGIKEI